jgi:O-antigen/teichoic acid export membrane protein
MTQKNDAKQGPQSHWSLSIADNTVQSLSFATVAKTVGLVVSVLVARRLGAENLGVYQQIAVLMTTLATITTWGMPVSIIPQLSCATDENKRQLLIQSSMFAAFGIAVIVALFLAVLSPYVSQLLLHRSLSGVLRLAAIGVVLLSGSALTGAWLQGLNRFRSLNVISVISSVAGGFIIVALTYLWGVVGAVSAVSAVALLFMLIAWLYNPDIRVTLTQPLKETIETLPRLLSAGTATLVGGLPAAVAPFFFTLMLGAQGMNNAGYFALSQTVFQVLLFLPNALIMALLPPLSRLTADDPETGRAALAASLNVCGSIVLIITSVIMGFLPWIVPILYGRGFGQGVPMIVGYAMAAPAAAINMIMVQFLLARRCFWKAAAFNALWLVMSMPGTAFFISRVGPAWAGAGLAISHTIAILLVMYLVRRSQPDIARILGKVTAIWITIIFGYMAANVTGMVSLSLLWMLLSAAVVSRIWRHSLTKVVKLLGAAIQQSKA